MSVLQHRRNKVLCFVSQFILVAVCILYLWKKYRLYLIIGLKSPYFIVLSLDNIKSISFVNLTLFIIFECSFFSWFSDTEVRDEVDEIHDEV